jgi:nicotinate dehydrogenase subunit A
MSTTLNVNGQDHAVEALPDSMLLYALRNDLALHGPKFGCGLAQCGACTVVMDGAAIRSCVTPLSAAAGHKITTLEGLGSVEKPHPLQQAFIDEQAVQCGYCINGMIMSAKALLDRNPKPSRDDIKQALNGNLCRCGTHLRIERAI